jgi:hypothetical protein
VQKAGREITSTNKKIKILAGSVENSALSAFLLNLFAKGKYSIRKCFIYL